MRGADGPSGNFDQVSGLSEKGSQFFPQRDSFACIKALAIVPVPLAPDRNADIADIDKRSFEQREANMEGTHR